MFYHLYWIILAAVLILKKIRCTSYIRNRNRNISLTKGCAKDIMMLLLMLLSLLMFVDVLVDVVDDCDVVVDASDDLVNASDVVVVVA